MENIIASDNKLIEMMNKLFWSFDFRSILNSNNYLIGPLDLTQLITEDTPPSRPGRFPPSPVGEWKKILRCGKDRLLLVSLRFDEFHE